jgi:hypothetical protein
VFLIQKGRNYVVYDKHKRIVIITSDKNIAKGYARTQYDRVRQSRLKR